MSSLVILPDPSPPAIAAARALAGDDAAWLVPWALPTRFRSRGPAAWRRFASRRRAPVDGAVTALAWPAIDAALAVWTRGRTDRRYRSMIWRRRAVATLAARRVGRGDVDRIIAPSLAALEPFAAAGPGTERVLLEDLPDLRQLHVDLERAAARHPDCAFLRRYRAPDSTLVRQRTEAALADRVVVRGHLAAARHRSKAQLAPRFAPEPAGTPVVPGAVVLAGLAAARHGSCELLEALEALPDLRVALRAGEGAEPPALLAHPRVQVIEGPVDVRAAAAVVAPSWVEAYPVEVACAAALGVPIIATRRAAGPLADSELTALIEPGDAPALIAAL